MELCSIFSKLRNRGRRDADEMMTADKKWIVPAIRGAWAARNIYKSVFSSF